MAEVDARPPRGLAPRGRALKVHSVTLRLKSRASLARKLARPDRTYARLWDVTDLIGLRVITYFEDGVDRVGQLVEARLAVDFHHSIDKRRARDTARFGYRSLHYVCRPDRASCRPRRATRFRHVRCSSTLGRDRARLGYKSRDAVPDAVRRRLNRLAGLLELVDQEFVAIRRELTDYAAALPHLIANADVRSPSMRCHCARCSTVKRRALSTSASRASWARSSARSRSTPTTCSAC